MFVYSESVDEDEDWKEELRRFIKCYIHDEKTEKTGKKNEQDERAFYCDGCPLI